MKKTDDELGGGAKFITDNWLSMVKIAHVELEDKRCAAPAAHAEEIAGIATLTLAKKWYELRSPLGAMYVFTAREARSHARKCRRQELATESNEGFVPLFHSQPGLDPEQILEQTEFIEWALALLNEQEEEVIVRRFFEDLSFASIAELMGKQTGTITSLYSRALNKIRKADASRQAADMSTPRTWAVNSLGTPKV